MSPRAGEGVRVGRSHPFGRSRNEGPRPIAVCEIGTLRHGCSLHIISRHARRSVGLVYTHRGGGCRPVAGQRVSRRGQVSHVLKDHRIADGELRRPRDTTGEGKDGHPCGQSRRHARNTVLDNGAALRSDIQRRRCVQEDIGSRLAVGDLLDAEDSPIELVVEPGQPQGELHPFVRSARCHAHGYRNVAQCADHARHGHQLPLEDLAATVLRTRGPNRCDDPDVAQFPAACAQPICRRSARRCRLRRAAIRDPSGCPPRCEPQGAHCRPGRRRSRRSRGRSGPPDEPTRCRLRLALTGAEGLNNRFRSAGSSKFERIALRLGWLQIELA